MEVTSPDRKHPVYATWYGFKKDLEKHSGRSLLNWEWLEIKPKAPLPWSDSHMHRALLAVACRGGKDYERTGDEFSIN